MAQTRFARVRVRINAILANTMLASALFAGLPWSAHAQAPRFEITVPATVHDQPLTGRLLLVLAKNAQPEPRLLVSPQGPPIFAIDLEQQPAGQPAILDSTALGYPGDLQSLPPGDYVAQVIINVYERVQRADGKTPWLPVNDGTIEFFNVAAGNIYSDPVNIRTGGGAAAPIRITANRVIAQRQPPRDTEWLKHVRIQSQLVTRFWDRPTYIHATVLLPRGYYENDSTRYPTIYTLGHTIPFSFNPDSTNVRNIGQINPVTGLETGYDFYKQWVSPDFPRVIAVTLRQQTPYFPDSYSVNSANNGPYGDAIIQEVIPELERRFRMIGKPYARILEGASTSGWQSLALILRNPDYFGGAWILQPDPIDFTRYQLTNIYEDENAFEVRSGELEVERPFRRTVEGQVVWTTRQLSRFEAVLGSRGRAGFQLSAWEAIYGPVDDEGYPVPLWDKLTGKIDKNVAEYMRANGYDLRDYAERNWPAIGPKLAGKLHFFAGDMDDFYLNLAVYRFEEFLKSTTNPKSDATFTYGRSMKGHSWHAWTWADMVREISEHVRRNAPRN